MSLSALEVSEAEAADVDVVTKAELKRHPIWRRGFASFRKDHRYYELLEETLREGFDYRYLAIRDTKGEVRAIQPLSLIHISEPTRPY